MYFSVENVGERGLFGGAAPTPDRSLPVKAALPQTFLDVFAKQAGRLD